MINKKFKINIIKKKTLLNSLFKSKTFYGNNIKSISKNNLPFIYGIRHKYSIINLKYTIYYLKRTLKLISLFLKKNKNILIIGDSPDIQFLLNKYYYKENKNIFIYKKNWINGLLTNDKIKLFFKKKNINLIIYLKSNNEDYLLKELYKSKIPIIALINTNINHNYINYPIFYNNKNIKSLFLLMYLIRKNINE